MTDDVLLSLLWAAWMAASTMPLGFILGAPCSPCCGCGVADGKPRTDPKDEGTWVPSGTWRGVGGVTWAFTANPGDDSGETWFFYGSAATSKIGGGASLAEQRDWANICNWYSNKTTSPSTLTFITTALNKRATSLPPATAVVHAYSSINTDNTGPQVIKNIYFWNISLLSGSAITTTAAAHDSISGAVFVSGINSGTVNGGATFSSNGRNFGIVSGGATLNNSSFNETGGIIHGGATLHNTSRNNGGTINDGATFNNSSFNAAGAVVNGGATFNNSASNNSFATINQGAIFNDSGNNSGTVNGGATFNNDSRTNGGFVNDGAVFNDDSFNGNFSTVNGGADFFNSSRNVSGATVNNGSAFNDSSRNGGLVNNTGTFNDSSDNSGTVNDGATFNNNSRNIFGTVNGGAEFNDSSLQWDFGTVNGGATFNDAACSRQAVGSFFATPCTRQFVAHPTDLPTCNGTAPDGCQNSADTCGCG